MKTRTLMILLLRRLFFSCDFSVEKVLSFSNSNDGNRFDIEKMSKQKYKKSQEILTFLLTEYSNKNGWVTPSVDVPIIQCRKGI